MRPLDEISLKLKPLEVIKDDPERLAPRADLEGLPEAIADIAAVRRASGAIKDNAAQNDPGQSSLPSPRPSPGRATDLEQLTDTQPRNSALDRPVLQTEGRFAAFLASNQSEDERMADGGLSPISRHSYDSHQDLPPVFRARPTDAAPLVDRLTVGRPVVSTREEASIDPSMFTKLCKDVTDIQTKVKTIEFKLDHPKNPPDSTPLWAVALGERMDAFMREVQEMKQRPAAPVKETAPRIALGRDQEPVASAAALRRPPTPISAKPSSPPPASDILDAESVTDIGADGMHVSGSATSAPRLPQGQSAPPKGSAGRGLFGSVRGLVSNEIRRSVTPLAPLENVPQAAQADNVPLAAFDIFAQSPPINPIDVERGEQETELFPEAQAGAEGVLGSPAPETQLHVFTDIADVAKTRTRKKRFLEDSPEAAEGSKKRKSTSVVTRELSSSIITRKPSNLGSTAPFTNTRARSRSAGSGVDGSLLAPTQK